jgi:hypothetical protein
MAKSKRDEELFERLRAQGRKRNAQARSNAAKKGARTRARSH